MSLPTTDNTTTTTASSYTAIRKQIERARLTPWSSAPAMRIGSFVVNPLSLRSMCDLEIAGNAFLTDGEMVEGDIAAYIWRHHPDYECGADPAKVIKQIAKEDGGTSLLFEVLAHLNAALEETPAGSHFGGTSVDNRLPAIPSIAAICHEYGAAYGVDPREVADIDLRIVFQCIRAIRLTAGIKYSEPKRLREAKSEFLKTHG